MELNFSTSCGQLTIVGQATFWLLVLYPCIAWALFSGQFRRPDRGAWRSAGLFVFALAPAGIGVLGTTLALVGVGQAISLSGFGVYSASAGVAEALLTTIVGFGVSIGLVATMFLWIPRLSSGWATGPNLPGQWLLGCLMTATCIAPGAEVVIGLNLISSASRQAEAMRLLILLGICAVAVVAVAVAAPRFLPREDLGGKGVHAIVASGTCIMLTTAALITYAAMEYFRNVARGA